MAYQINNSNGDLVSVLERDMPSVLWSDVCQCSRQQTKKADETSAASLRKHPNTQSLQGTVRWW